LREFAVYVVTKEGEVTITGSVGVAAKLIVKVEVHENSPVSLNI